MLALIAAFLLSGASSKAEFQPVRILYTGDLHARTAPGPDFAAAGLPRRVLGGWTGLFALISAQRTDACLVVDCGDFGFGSEAGDSSQGRISIEFLNATRYDAAVPGARDFTGGPENLELLAKTAEFPVLADPMLDVVLKRQVPLFRPYFVRDMKGARVAVVGLTDPDIPLLNRHDDFGGLVVDDPVTQVARYLPAVEAESADVVVVIGHIRPADGCRIADSFPAVNLVICGAEPGAPESRLTHRNTTPVLVAGAYGQRLGVADIMFNKTEHRVYQVETRMLNVTPGPAGDSTVAARRVTELCRAGADTAVCVNMTECAPDSVGRLRLGALVAEAVRRKAQADIAVLPAYALESGLAAGPATRQDLFAVVPFQERLRFLIVDDTTMTRLVAPDSVNQHEPAPLLAGADYFVVGDTLSWPEISQVERVRMRDRKPGQYRVVTTEQWLERARAHVFGSLLPQTLTDLWIGYAVAQETLKPVAGIRLYPATPGLVRQQTGGPVNINTADSQLLQTLPGVGPKTAERIIEYRQTSGRFKSIEEIQNVKGIGPKRYEKIRTLITVR